MLDKKRASNLFECYGLDAMILTSPENLFYVSGLPVRHMEHNPVLFNVSNQYPTLILIDKNGYSILISWNIALIESQPLTDECRGISSKESALTELANAVKKFGLSRAAIGLEEKSPVYLLEFLRSNFPDATLKIEDRLMLDLRLKKNDQEITRIRRAAAIAGAAIQEVARNLQEGRTDSELILIAKESMLAAGASGWDHLSMSAGGGTGLFPTRGYRLKQGDLVGTDFGAIFEGYCSDLNRLTVLGRASPSLRRLYQEIIEIQSACVNKIKPGVEVAEIYEEGLSAFARHGIVPSMEMMGHSIGIQVEESPLIKKDIHLKFEENMVFNVEIYSKTERGQYIGIEDMYLLTSSGVDRLTMLDRTLNEA